jgi:chitinase
MASLNLLVAGLIISLSIVGAEGQPRFQVAGYLPEYRAATFDPDTARGVTDLFLFSVEPTITGQLETARLARFPWPVLEEFKVRHGVRLILCVGGWGRSQHFSTVARTASLREEFVRSALRICQERGLDGLDLDWEHPVSREEQEGYADLMVELREGLAPHGLVVSLTMAAWQEIPQRAFDAVHQVQIMSYDHPGAHSTDDLFFNGIQLIRQKTEYALEAGLGGVMFWELGQDAMGDDSLLRVIQEVVSAARTGQGQDP